MAPATFLIRLAYPIDSASLLSGLQFWEWPAWLLISRVPGVARILQQAAAPNSRACKPASPNLADGTALSDGRDTSA